MTRLIHIGGMIGLARAPRLVSGWPLSTARSPQRSLQGTTATVAMAFAASHKKPRRRHRH